jgi:hypothetical protein
MRAHGARIVTERHENREYQVGIAPAFSAGAVVRRPVYSVISSLRYLLLFLASLALILLLLTACWGDDSDTDDFSDTVAGDGASQIDLEAVTRVDELVQLLESGEPDALRGHRFEIDAWVSPPPRNGSNSSTPPQGCPVVPEKQDWLSDDPLPTQVEVAGAILPNERLDDELPVLRLVIPYTLGFVEIPDRARLAGYVLDGDHADCPGADSLFILEDVLEALPGENDGEFVASVDDWDRFSYEPIGITLEYPAGWEVEERDAGQYVRIRFLGPDPFRTIRLEIHEGATYWHPDASDSGAPDVLSGARQELAMAGPANARLIDDDRRTGTGEREARLVFNHKEQTIFLAMLFRDGAELETDALWVLSEMAERLNLNGDVTMSDPMDPILVASGEIGEGPFLSEADARYVAVNSSGMTGAEVVHAELVSERDARDAVEGACRNFDGRPPAVWLVTVEGITPGGSEASRLVYLDGATGNRLCQAEAPGVS